jgi:hypothetical protein
VEVVSVEVVSVQHEVFSVQAASVLAAWVAAVHPGRREELEQVNQPMMQRL